MVNADPGNEVNWCGSGVQHGCFRRTVSSSWFRAHPQPGVNIPAVYLFSQAGNSASYHYIGNEHSPTYAIIAHEIGHYVTWTYGGFRSASESSGPMRRTLSEGFSMLYPMLMGLDRWPTSVSFEDVVTGRLFDDPLDSATTIQRHTDLSCSADPYELAEPFLQAMWRLMNNRDMNGAPIWAADALAREAVADRLMHALFTHGNNTQATWVTIAFDVLNRTSEAIYTDYTDVVATPGQTLLQIVGVFNAHGLLSTCNP